ncbi:hypothetical protein N7524_011767 [Penicillium chrysogenum]|nr:hypothetical protein N7524_011767 [Penicillium chrysogenum]
MNACTRGFATPKDLMRHKQTVHKASGRVMAYCHYLTCDYSANGRKGPMRQDNLQRHIGAKHHWLQLLRESEARGEENVNPAVKLIDHFEEMYGDESLTRQKWMREFATAKAERDSVTLRNGLSIVENRILDRYARDWFMRWTNFWSGYRE